jgi:beta-mannosidase
MTSYIMEHHQRSRNGNGLMVAQMTDTFRMPGDFQSLVYLSMVLQAEGIRYGVEHWRRNRERVSGTLIWQLNDCWPVASWSSIDYFGRWKALHYAARRFYAPVLLSVEDNGLQMGIHLTNDLTRPWQGRLVWRLEEITGAVLDSGEQEVIAAPLADMTVAALDFANRINDGNCRKMVLVCELWQGQERISACVSAFVPGKHLELTAPGLKVEMVEKEGQLTINLHSVSLACFVELKFEGADVVFSDNYFDLSPNQPVTVTVPLPRGWTLEQARQMLKVRSLYDSY